MGKYPTTFNKLTYNIIKILIELPGGHEKVSPHTGTRQSLADPDWFKKIRFGRGAEVSQCLFSNYCEGLDQKHKQVTCQQWDRIGRDEPHVSLSKDGRRRLMSPSLK